MTLPGGDLKTQGRTWGFVRGVSLVSLENISSTSDYTYFNIV